MFCCAIFSEMFYSRFKHNSVLIYAISCMELWAYDISIVWTSASSFTRVDSEESRGAAKVLPGEGGVFLEVIGEHVIQSFRHVDSIEDVGIFTQGR